MPDADPVSPGAAPGELFIGPFPSWADVKRDYGAKGDGQTDDTAALQKALDDVGAAGKKAVVYFPAGQYRLTGTLRLYKKVGVALLGEDPATTTLVWNGGAGQGDNGGVMLLGQGSTAFRVGRLTFDGQRTASFAIRLRWGSYASTEFFPSGMQFHDLVIKDATNGIGAGNGKGVMQDTAEYSHVYRSRFYRCSYAGLVTSDFNSLLWGVRDSHFEGNGYGVRMDAGNVGVYDSVFKGSTKSDVSAGLASFVGVRGNYSSGSQTFVDFNGNVGAVTLQGNTILDSKAAAVALSNMREAALLGNTIRSGDAPAVSVIGNGTGLLSTGNRYSATSWLMGNQNTFSRSVDDMTGVTIQATEPVLPATPTRFSGPVVMVAELTGKAVQSAIDIAVQQAAGHPAVVYLPTGNYVVANTINVPANVDLRVVGDGRAFSMLVWGGGAGAGPVLALAGPSRARLQDISVKGARTTDGLVIGGADQVGGQVIVYSLQTTATNVDNIGVSIEGLDDTRVELITPHYFGGRQGALTVVGGPNAAARAKSPANVRLLDGFPNGGSNTSAITFAVRAGGRLISLDQWAETVNTNYVKLDEVARVTVNGGSFGFDKPLDHAFIVAAGFTGRLTLMGLLLGNTNISVSGANPNQNVLLATSHLDGWSQANVFSRLDNTATAGTTKSLLNVGNGVWYDKAPNDADVADPWLLEMVEDLRSDHSTRLKTPPAGATAVEITRFGVEVARNAIRIAR